MVHGGGWRIGDKANRSVVENKIAHWLPQGHVFVSVNNRLLPQADPMTQARDVAKALAAVQAHAVEWSADPSHIVLMGHSAGAHLVALLSARPRTAYEQGAKAWLGTVLLDSAALDVERVMRGRHLRLYDEAFGASADDWRSASPIVQLTAAAPPLLLVCSTRRRDDPCGTAREFATKAGALSVKATVLPQDLTHAEVNRNLGLPGPYTDAVDAFLRGLAAPAGGD